MNTMTLITTTERSEDLLLMADTQLESWFSDAGLSVEAVAHCDSAECSTCFLDEHASTGTVQAA